MFRLVVAGLALLPALATATTAIVNVSVLPMTTETVLPARTVLVDDGVVVEIGPVDTVRVPEDALLIDGTDRFLMPGLGEMHAHVPASDTRDLERVLTLFAANGVTTIRGMLGAPAHLGLRADLAAGRRFGPRLVTSGPSLNGNSVRGIDDARRRVREQHAAGYDFLKIHPGLSRDEFLAIAETANALGIPFAGHVPVAVGVELALASGMATIDHLDGYMAAMLSKSATGAGGFGGFFGVFLADSVDTARLDAIVDATAASTTWNVPTETLIEQRLNATDAATLAAREEMQYMPAASVRDWVASKRALREDALFRQDTADRAIEIRRRLILELFRKTGRVLLGSDAPQVFNVPGFSAHDELASYVAGGLTPYEALSTGTTAVAEFLDINTGTVEVGRAADLVLLDDNPFEDIANTRRIHGVMLRGSWYSRAELDTLLGAFRRDDD